MTEPNARPRMSHKWERHPEEWYVEPPDCSAALFAAEPFEGGIWDAACGRGNVMQGAALAGISNPLTATDLHRRGLPPHWAGRLDFLNYDGQPLQPNIVSNPPYGRGVLLKQFVEKALAIATGKVAVFTELTFLGSETRLAWYEANKPARVLMVVPRPSCPPGDYLEAGNKATGGRVDYCWIVWDRQRPGVPTEFGYANRGPFRP